MSDVFEFDGNFVAGRMVAGTGTLAVEDPATEEAFTEVPTSDLVQFDAAIAAAHSSFESGVWARRPVAERVETMVAMADWFSAHRAELVETIIRETGSTATLRWCRSI